MCCSCKLRFLMKKEKKKRKRSTIWGNAYKTMSDGWAFVSRFVHRLSLSVWQALLRLPLLWNRQQVGRGLPREGVRVAAADRGVPYRVHVARLCVQHHCQQSLASEYTLPPPSTWTEAKSVLAEGEKETEGSETDRWSEIHTSLAHAKAGRTDFIKGIGSSVEPPIRAECKAFLCGRKLSLRRDVNRQFRDPCPAFPIVPRGRLCWQGGGAGLSHI